MRPDGKVEHLTPHEYGALIVIDDEPGDFFSPHDAPLAHEAFKLLLAGDGKESEALTQRMTPAGQQVMQDIYHKQRASLTPAILAEIDKQRDKLAAASPAGHLRFIRAPVLLLHGSDDTRNPADRAVVAEARHSARSSGRGAGQPGHHSRRGRRQAQLRDRLALVHWMEEMIQVARSTTRGGPPESLPAGAWIAKQSTWVSPF